MTREETSKVIRVLSIAFPTFLRGKDQGEISEVIDLWCLMFDEYSYMEVNAALKTFIATSEYPPKIAAVLNKLNLVKSATTEELNEMTAWNVVFKAIGDSCYHAEERYNEFPALIKKVIKSPAELKEMSQMDLKTINSVTQSNFMRAFKAEQKREKEIQSIPREIRDRLGMNEMKAIEEVK